MVDSESQSWEPSRETTLFGKQWPVRARQPLVEGAQLSDPELRATSRLNTGFRALPITRPSDLNWDWVSLLPVDSSPALPLQSVPLHLILNRQSVRTSCECLPPATSEVLTNLNLNPAFPQQSLLRIDRVISSDQFLVTDLSLLNPTHWCKSVHKFVIGQCARHED